MYDRILFHRAVNADRLREARQRSLGTRDGQRVFRLVGRRSQRSAETR